MVDEDDCPFKFPVVLGSTGVGVTDGPGVLSRDAPGVGPWLDRAERGLLPACAYSAGGRDAGRDLNTPDIHARMRYNAMMKPDKLLMFCHA